MPLPVIPVIAIAVSALAGIGGATAGIQGGTKIASAQGKESEAKKRHEDNLAMFEDCGQLAEKSMDELGTLELEVLESFEGFVDIVSCLQNAPTFDELNQAKLDIPDFDQQELREVAIGAKAAIGGVAGAAVGTAGGIAAAGATTTIIGALGTASTGTAIVSLNGVAATNAILAWLGGGSLAVGGGGMAVGSAVLGTATAGVSVLVAGVIVNFVGQKIEGDADELCRQVDEEEAEINRACDLLSEIRSSANKYRSSITRVYEMYKHCLSDVTVIVEEGNKTDWNSFTDGEKLVFQNTVLLVGLLYKMCGVNLVIDDDGDGSADRVNHDGIDSAMDQAGDVIEELEKHAA